MGFRRWLAKKIVKGDSRQINEGNDNFTDEGREISGQVRRIRAEKRRLQEEMELMELKADYRRLKRDLEEYEDEANPDENADLFGGNSAPEALLSTIIGGALLGKNAANSGRPDPNSMQTQAQTQNTPTPAVSPDLSQEQINSMVDQVPRKYLKLSRNFDDPTIAQLVVKYFPGATQNDLVGIIAEIRRRA